MALSKFIWTLKDLYTAYNITWSVRKKGSAYNKSKRCHPLAEKLAIMRADKGQFPRQKVRPSLKVQTRKQSFILPQATSRGPKKAYLECQPSHTDLTLLMSRTACSTFVPVETHADVSRASFSSQPSPQTPVEVEFFTINHLFSFQHCLKSVCISESYPLCQFSCRLIPSGSSFLLSYPMTHFIT